MRVVYVIPGMHGGGGAERSLAATLPFLAHDIHADIVTWTGRDDLRAEVETVGATITDLGSVGRVATVRALRDFIQDVGPDIVHTTLIDADVVGRTAAAASRVPVVSSLVNVNHGLDVLRSGAGPLSRRVQAWSADALTARLVVRFHALTDHVASVMSRRLLIPSDRIEVIPRGRDPVRLGMRSPDRRAAARAAHGVRDDQFLVCAAARHERQKGLDVLLRSIPQVVALRPDATFIVGGRHGNQTSELEALVAELGIADAVRFIGQRDDVADLMCAADAWCVPSRWEGFGGILLEAMCLQVPIVASDVPAVREVAGDPPVAALVPPGDHAALARALVAIADDATAAAASARRARQRFLDEFSVDAVSTQMVAFYERALAESRWRH